MTDEQTVEAQNDRTWPAWFILVLLVIFLGVLAYRVYPAQHPLPKNPNFIDSTFANNLVLFAARLTLIATSLVLAIAAVFIVISFWKRAKAGHWLTRFGPLETQAVDDLREEVTTWQGLWREATEENANLETQLAESNRVIQLLTGVTQEDVEDEGP